MEKMIPDYQLKQINQSLKSENQIFVPILPSNSKFEIEKLSDTLLTLKLHNDTLEYHFKDDMKYLILTISDSINEISKKGYGYYEIKSFGAKIVIGNETVKKIYITYDFTDMPDKFEICWCSILAK